MDSKKSFLYDIRVILSLEKDYVKKYEQFIRSGVINHKNIYVMDYSNDASSLENRAYIYEVQMYDSFMWVEHTAKANIVYFNSYHMKMESIRKSLYGFVKDVLLEVIFHTKPLIFKIDNRTILKEISKLCFVHFIEMDTVPAAVNYDKKINALMFMKAIEHENMNVSRVFNAVGREIITFL